MGKVSTFAQNAIERFLKILVLLLILLSNQMRQFKRKNEEEGIKKLQNGKQNKNEPQEPALDVVPNITIMLPYARVVLKRSLTCKFF